MPHPYRLDDTAERLRAKAAGIAAEVAAPNAANIDVEARFPTESMAALARAGFYGTCLPESVGGLGQGMRTFCAVAEELAQACASTAMVYVMHTSAAQTLASSTTLKNKDALLAEIAKGAHLTTLALSEKGSRANFWAPVSQLRPEGNGFTTSAYKSWITAANHADSYVADAQRPDAQNPLESTVYLLKRTAPGVRTIAPFDGLGLRGNDSAPVALEGAHISVDDLVSDVGAGAKTLLEVVLPWFAVGTSAMAHGLCLASLGATIKHLQETGFEHDGRKLRDLQNLRVRVSHMFMRTEQSRALLGRCLDEIESGGPAAPLFVLEARVSALEAAVEVTDLAMKTCGGAAFSKHLPLERLFRDARAGWVMAPTVDHLQDFAGKALTGLPLF